MKFNIFNRAPSSNKKEEDTGREEKPSNIESAEKTAEIVNKLGLFRDNLNELNEHTADDYVKNLMQLEKSVLSSQEAQNISSIHSEVMQNLRKSGKLKEFTQGLAVRNRIKSLSGAIEIIGKMIQK